MSDLHSSRSSDLNSSDSDLKVTEGCTWPIDRIDVWTFSVAGTDEAYEQMRALLTPDELARADRFIVDSPRHRFVMGRGSLRLILASYLNCQPREVIFEYGEHGKPTLMNTVAAGLRFNASGSYDLAACAVTMDRELGIDIENTRRTKDFDQIVERFFTAAERDAYRRLTTEEKHAAFFRGWTRKEAYLKATGSGLTRPLASFEITLAPGDEARLVADERIAGAPQRWTFLDIAPGEHYAGSLVIADDARPICYRRL